jgi:hypothetical protein
MDPTSSPNYSAANSYHTDQNFAMAYNYSNSPAASQYYSSALSTSLVRPAQLGTGALVSADLGNGLAVTANGSQFTVTDLSSGSIILTGALDAPIRSFAVEPGSGIAYFTVPDSNSVITVNLPAISDPLPQF